MFLAWDPALRRQVALKVPQPEGLVTSEARKRFLREGHAAAGLDHPNIVPVYESGHIGTVGYIASAYCAGPTLAEWLARQSRPVPERDAAALIATLARAVDHAHERGVLHRDLKPSNVLLQRPEASDPAGRSLADVQPRITDFSLAWIADGEGPRTLSGVPLGSPPYMAPEQAEGRLEAIGPPTDVYGLGCILYELLIGQPPFRGESHVEILRKVITDDVLPPRRAREDLPIALEAIVLKCLAKDPARRFPNARELADDVTRFLNGEPTRARPPGGWEKLARTARRHPAAVVVMTISAVFVSALLIGGRLYANRLEESRQRARQGDDEARRRGLELRRARYIADLRQVPDYILSYKMLNAQERLVRNRPRPGEEDLREFAWYHLWRRCHQERRTLADHDDEVYSVEFSPRGDLLASAGKDGTVRIWETSNWQLVRTIVASPTEVNVAAFSPDGQTIATVEDEGKLKLWQTASGRLLREWPAHSGDAVIARFTHDGKTIITGGRDDGFIKLWDRSTGVLVHAFRAAEHKLESAVFSPDGSILAVVGGRTVKLWKFADRTPIASIPTDDSVQAVAFSHDGTRLAIAYEGDAVVRLWDVSSRQPLREFRGHTDGVFSVAFSPDDRTIFTGSGDDSIRSWDVATGAESGVWLGHTHKVWAVAVSPDGRAIASASADGNVKLWDAESPRDRFKLPIRQPVAFGFSPDGQTLLTFEVAPQWSVARWDARSGLLLERRPLNLTGARVIAGFSRDVRLLALAIDDTAITLCDLVTGQRQSLPGPASRDIYSLEFSPDNRYLLVSRGRQLWNLSSHHVVAFPWEERDDSCFTPSGDLMTVLRSGHIGSWDPRTGRARTVLPKPRRGMNLPALSPDGRILASVAHAIDLWSADTLDLIKEMPTHSRGTRPVAFSPDGKTLASAADDRTVKLWDVATGEELLTLEGFRGAVWVMAFSPDGRALATMASTPTPGNLSEIIVWRAAGYEMDQTPAGPDRSGRPAR